MTNDSKQIVILANSILESYQRQGYDLSLRQLYYQFIAQDRFPDSWIDDEYNRKNGLPYGTKNTEKNYKRLGGIISDARMCGYLDWDMIVDRGRETTQNNHWDSPKDILLACAKQFRYDLWDNQPWHIEVMVEKQALEGVLEPVCKQLDIPFTANKGYSSSSSMYQAGQRLAEKLEAGKNICVIYLGDHDPSGIDMTRDVEDRLKLFSGYNFYQPPSDKPEEWRKAAYQTMNTRRFERYRNAAYGGQAFEVARVALNMDQVQEYNPPPNPAKITDSRANSYIDQFGEESWELDALEPSLLAQLVEEQVLAYRDEDAWAEAEERQSEVRTRLTTLAQGWEN